jgi:hypothetical protein
MGLAARRRGAYGEEYLRAGLHLHTRGGRRKAKDLVKLGQENTTKRQQTARRLKTVFQYRDPSAAGPFITAA